MNSSDNKITLKVKDIMDRIRHVSLVMFHKDESSKMKFIAELTMEDLEHEFSWFEVTTFKGIPCVEFNL